ncbi:MAG: GAF domain-containing protein [Candidatus Planktophila sp.]|nr:GAF domain-containing protein [Candidatus Planktophila sp.]
MLIGGSFIGQETFVARSKGFLPANSPTPWFLTKGLITTSNSMLPHFWSVGAVLVRKAEKLLIKALSKLLVRLGLTSDERYLLQVDIEALANLIRVRYGAIGILNESDESGKTFKYFIHTGITPEIVKSIGILPMGRGLLGAVILENAGIRIEDMSKDPRSTGFPPGYPPMKSLLAVPIFYEGHMYGRIYLSEKLNGLPFNEDDEVLVQNFSNSLAKTLDESIRSRLSAHV